MNVDFKRVQHWAAGSYIDLMLAALVMQITFALTYTWIIMMQNDFVIANLEEVLFSLQMQVALGWLMCIIVAMGFSLLPLIFDVEPFDPSLMRIYAGLNMAGQASMTLGLIIGDIELFRTMTTIGLTFLCASLVTLLAPARIIFKRTHKDEDALGPFAYAIGMFLPALGIIILTTWIGRDYSNYSLEFGEKLILNLFLPLAMVSIFLSHFNRRLECELIKPKNLGKFFGIYITLLIIQFLAFRLLNQQYISNEFTAILVATPYVFGFIMLRPDKIIQLIINKEPCHKGIVAAYFWLPIVGIFAAIELFTFSAEYMIISRMIFIFGVCMQGLWGFAWYLHEDHKKISIHRRSTHWVTFVSLNIGTIIMIIALTPGIDNIDRNMLLIGLSLQGIAYISILVRWIKDVLFSLDEWHRIPMFYDRYLSDPELGSGFNSQ
jgi:hypothetical protein